MRPQKPRPLTIADSPNTSNIIDRQPPRPNPIKVAPSRTPAPEQTFVRKGSPAVKAEAARRDTPTRLGSSYPAVKTSTIDVDATPVYNATGKPITEVDLDAGNIRVFVSTRDIH